MGSLYKDSKKENEDFEWMPDLNGADWYPNSKLTVRAGAKKHLSAKLVLTDAEFYTFEKSENEGQQINPDGTPGKKIGKIGRVLGADIKCARLDQSITIKIKKETGEIITEDFPSEKGPYFITVETTPVGEERDHLPHIYHLLEMKPEPPKKFGFRYTIRENPWKNPCKATHKVTTFACQTFPGGDGPLPDFP